MVDVLSTRSRMPLNQRAAGQDSAEKVLRRAHIARVVTNLKSRLALATFKTQRGLENCNFDALESLPLQTDQTDANTSPGSSPIDGRQSSFQRATITTPPRFNLNVTPKQSSETMPPPPRFLTTPEKRQYSSFSSPPNRKQLLVDQLRRGSPAKSQLLGSALAPSPVASTDRRRRKRGRTLEGAAMPAPTVLPQSASVPAQLDRSHSYGEAPSTPPPSHAQLEPTTPTSQQPASTDQEGANLLLYLATSPGHNMPRTPRTPDVNFNEYCNFFTPSPTANRVLHPATPNSINRARQHLNFEV